VIQGGPAALRITGRINGQGIREIDIEPAVIIIVKQGDAAAHRLDYILLLSRGVVSELDSRALRNIDEPHSLFLWLEGSWQGPSRPQ